MPENIYVVTQIDGDGNITNQVAFTDCSFAVRFAEKIAEADLLHIEEITQQQKFGGCEFFAGDDTGSVEVNKVMFFPSSED